MIVAMAVAAVVLVAGATLAVRELVSGDGGGNGQSAGVPGADRPIAHRSFLELVIPARRGGLPGAGASAAIARTVKTMSVEDKVAQLMLLGFAGTDASSTAPVLELLRTRPLGGIVIRRSNYSDTGQVAALAGQATLVAREAHHDPPFVWAPQEGGAFNVIPSVGPPDAAADLQRVSVARSEAGAAGRDLAALNVNGVLAPVVDVDTESGGVLVGRAFSNVPRRVARYATAVVSAYKRAGIVTAAEHFPGLGAANQPVEDGPSSVGLSLAQLRKRDLVPFKAAIGAGVPAIVISNASYATDDFVTPATLSRAISTDLLRGEMRFRGVAIADDLSQPAITVSMSVADAAVQAIRAGSDMVYISGPARGQEATYQALLQAARAGTIPRGRLDEAVTRVLTLKREYGLVRGLQPRTNPTSVSGGTPPTATTVPTTTTPAAPTPPQPAQPSTQSASPPGP
jgi:beta-N-acetylhexosaminidase